ncbi:MAG: hypothetical protein BGO81_00630 [Devosia sp. 66-22]|nr:MAG: hypothetical protein BGO81_00630 [Devosia sp. 66-22]
MHMSVTGDERDADQEARPEMTVLSTLLSTLARIEAALSSMDRAIREIGDRAGRGDRNRRWMNG